MRRFVEMLHTGNFPITDEQIQAIETILQLYSVSHKTFGQFLIYPLRVGPFSIHNDFPSSPYLLIAL